MDAFGVLDEVLADYQSFVNGFLNIQDDRVRQKVEREIEDGLLWPEPWLALNPAFEPGGTVGELVDRGVLHPPAREIFRVRTEEDRFGRELTFHRHQVDAFEVANRRESYVLTTGTGSGKSMAYIVPIVDRVLREGSGKGVRAIVVYPMNALANSQCKELEKFLGKDHRKVTFARYTGQEKPGDREVILQSPPDILLTNYVMLELMLTRPRERSALITSAANLSFLVLDELHTYRGRQGADVAMLVRRLRGAVGTAVLQCIGTSATLAGPGTKAQSSRSWRSWSRVRRRSRPARTPSMTLTTSPTTRPSSSTRTTSFDLPQRPPSLRAIRHRGRWGPLRTCTRRRSPCGTQRWMMTRFARQQRARGEVDCDVS